MYTPLDLTSDLGLHPLRRAAEVPVPPALLHLFGVHPAGAGAARGAHAAHGLPSDEPAAA